MRAILRDLGDGLILRQSTATDAELLAEFYAGVFGAQGEPGEPVGQWTHDLLTLPHPTFTPDSFTVVEDEVTGRIVSALCLISQTWTYDRILFGVGRPELVATDSRYRRRGLVRAQMDIVHDWSRERGELVQAITGIPWYYRQFGYEMALALSGGRAGYAAHVPSLAEGTSEPYRLRPALDTDAPFLEYAYAAAQRRYPLSCVRDAAVWRLEIAGRTPGGSDRVEVRIIETADGNRVGYLAHYGFLRGQMLAALQYEVVEGVSWLAVTPSVVRYLWATGQTYAAQSGQALHQFGFWHGAEHPVYQTMLTSLPRIAQPYAYYLRVADLPAFLRHIASALETRLARSIGAGHTETLNLSLYRGGVRLVFERGRLTQIETWTPEPEAGGDAAFPDLTFLQLLFGYRSLDDIERAFPDCRVAHDEARALLNALFPKQPSDVWALS